jgi:hypothetical protein
LPTLFAARTKSVVVALLARLVAASSQVPAIPAKFPESFPAGVKLVLRAARQRVKAKPTSTSLSPQESLLMDRI